MPEKIYIKGISAKKGKFGIRISFNVLKFSEELQRYANEKDYVNIFLNESREPDRYGNDHYAVLDSWKPEQAPNPKTEKKYEPENLNPPETEDLPF